MGECLFLANVIKAVTDQHVSVPCCLLIKSVQQVIRHVAALQTTFLSEKLSIFSYPSVLTYVLCAQKKPPGHEFMSIF